MTVKVEFGNNIKKCDIMNEEVMETETTKMVQVYEGTPEQLVRHIQKLPTKKHYKMTLIQETQENTANTPNELGLEMLRDVARLKEGMKETDGKETDRLLREARLGAMYGDTSSTD